MNLRRRDGCRRHCGFPIAVVALLVAGVAHATSTVTGGHARFEFLTPSLVRLEWSPSGRFVDARTVVVEKRDWPDVGLHRRTEDGWLVVSTGVLTLRYRMHSGAFSADDLQVQWQDGGSTHAWHPGEADWSCGSPGMTIG